MSGILTSNLKVIRAKQHLDTLDMAIREFRANPEKHRRVSTYDDTLNGWFVVRCQALNEDDIFGLGLVAGDFISNLRSSLDHLAWHLALLNERFPSKNICFPVIGQNNSDTQLKITKSTFGIPDDAIALIKSFQPYHSGEAYKSTHLWRLHFLWNTDKHRNIVLGGTATEEVVTVPSDLQNRISLNTLEDGAEIRIPLSEKYRIAKLNQRPLIDVRFGDEERGVILVLEDLADIYKFVTAEVLPGFERFFP